MMYRVLTFLTLMATWIVFSGLLDPFHLALGVISSAFVTIFSGDMFFIDRERSLGERVAEAARIPGYLAWLFWEILKANVEVLYMALHPRSLEQLEPCTVRFKTRLKSDYAKYIFANSITLTPGTVTISIDGDEFLVHAITRKMADSLPGEMEKRVAAAFEARGRKGA